MDQVAIYVSTHHGMMGNNYHYAIGEDDYNVAVRILGTPETVIIKNREQIAMYTGSSNKDEARIMPEEAFRGLGIKTDEKRPIEKWEVFGSPLDSNKWDVL